MTVKLALITASLALAAAAPAAATVTIGTGSGVVQPDENLLFTNSPPNADTIVGVTNQTNTQVSIAGGETLAGTGGQARVEAADGLISSPFTYQGASNQLLGFDLVDPTLAFRSTELRIFVGKGTATQATLTFYDTQGQQFQSTFTIPSNGFFYANATGGEAINYFTIAANGSFEDVRQVRLGEVGLFGAIPEPAAWAMMTFGFGAAGGLLRRRRTLVMA